MALIRAIVSQFFSFSLSSPSLTTSHFFSTVGLIYVNPGGPVGNKGIPAASAKNIRFPVIFKNSTTSSISIGQQLIHIESSGLFLHA